MGESAPGVDCFRGGGEMGARMRAMDWASTPLGPPSEWPRALRTTVQLMLGSRYPMFLWWGPDLVNLYNDGYISVLGQRHPRALGKSAREIWSDIWGTVGPQAEAVVREGVATWNEDLLLVMERNGFAEETYFTFSYSPAPDDDGSIAGVFCACYEETGRVVGERRLRLLRELTDSTAGLQTEDEVCAAAASVLEKDPHDLPFAALYLLDSDRQRGRRVGATGAEPEAFAPAELDLSDERTPWPISEAAASGKPLLVENLESRLAHVPAASPWPETVQKALVLPIGAGSESGVGFLVAGLSPRRPFDEDYRGFLELVAGHISTALANARVHRQERERAEALAELDRAKTTFFSNVSHEFRTPLTLMLGPIEDALEIAGRDSPELRDRLELVQRNSQRLLRLVNTLLDFSRIEAGRIQGTYVPTDLGTFSRDIASVFRAAIERAGLRLVTEVEPISAPAYVDRDMWEKIVLNLLSNAYKYTLEGEIRLRVAQDGDRVQLSVSDTGIGIPASELPHLFERFHRVEGANGRSYEGTGIGLALVKELVSLHGGTMQVESEPGRGTTFTVSIPLGSAHLPRERVAGEPSSPRLPAGPLFLPETAAVPERAPAPGTGRPRVLVADDNADLREYVTRLLEPQYEVECAADGYEALVAARQRLPDLVLADVMMPRLDGFGLLRELRQDPDTWTVPIILLSARAGEESRIEGLERGADDYLSKPFSANELRARVAAHLELARVRLAASEVLRESEQRFRNMADHSPLMLWVTDASGSCTYLNRQWCDFTGQSEADGLGYGWLDMTHPEDRQRASEIFITANETRAPFRVEYRLRHRDGGYRWAIDAAAPRFSPSGEFLGYVGSVIDISERKAAEDELREGSQRKDEFLAMLAHELRNPLSPITASAYLLQRQRPDDTVVQRHREVIDRQSRHLTRLLDDLLDVSRITRGKVDLRRSRIDLAAIVPQVLEASRPMFQERGHEDTVTVTVPASAVWVEGDEVRLSQVLMNLLTNAAKFTEPDGRIEVALAREHGEAVLSVRDTGQGISETLLPHVFDLFQQGERGLDRVQGGLGVGLTLVKSLVEMHGGRVEAHSEGPGRGSEFVVRLPLAEAPQASDPARDVSESPPAAHRRRILVVDDNVDAAEVTSEILETWGYEVRTAHDGRSALREAPVWQPDLVLLDIGMPGMDGFQVAAELRKNSELDGVRLVALTGYGQESDRVRGQAVGFSAHLVKPLDPQRLAEVVESLLR